MIEIIVVFALLGFAGYRYGVYRDRMSRRINWHAKQQHIDFGPIPEAVKHQAWRRAGGQCEICGSEAFLQYDHKVPRKWGGSNTLSNIQVLCNSCHKDKTRVQAMQ